MLISVPILLSFGNYYVEGTSRNRESSLKAFKKEVIDTATLFPMKIFFKIFRLETNFWLGANRNHAPHIKWSTAMQIQQNQYLSFKEELLLHSIQMYSITNSNYINQFHCFKLKSCQLPKKSYQIENQKILPFSCISL